MQDPCVILLGLKLCDIMKHDDKNIAYLCHYKVKFIVVQSRLLVILPMLSITNCITIKLFYDHINSTNNAVRYWY